MNINLSIDGFKKGNVYLQKIKDSALVNIDSVFVQNGDIIKLKHIKMFLYDEIKKYEAIKEPLTGAELGRLELAKELYERIT